MWGNRLLRAGLTALLPIVLAGCELPPPDTAGRFERKVVLFDPAQSIQQDWIEMPLVGTTEYRISSLHDRLSIRAVGKRSASGLVLPVTFDPDDCPVIEWSWRIEVLQESASLTERDREDVAASLFILFGDPGSYAAPREVPTLRYVWTNSRQQIEDIVDSPYLPGVVRSIVVETGSDGPAAWVEEKRDLLADFQAAFGRKPRDSVHAIAIFTDNDQTGEPVVAHYGAANLLCAGVEG